jgi:signal transduction histidine kinase
MEQQLKILIIEDDKGLGELIKRRLNREGHECKIALSAEDALEMLVVNPFDLALMDMGLPDMSGELLITEFKKNNITTPFIVVTGKGSESLAVKMIKKGAKDYLVKNSELLDVLPATIEMVWRELQIEALLLKAREEINNQKITLEAISEFSPHGILLIDENNFISYANKQLKKIWNLTNESLIGKKGNLFFSQLSENSNIKEYRDLILNVATDYSGMIIKELRVQNRILEIYTAPLPFGENSSNYGRIWYFLDITTHKQAQIAIEKANRETARNAEIKNKLFALVSHDIKAPLNSIIGFGDLLAESELSEDQKEYIKIIQSSTKHLADLMNDVLDLSRLEHGSLQFNNQEFSLDDLLEACISSSRLQAENRGIQIKLEQGEKLPDAMVGDMGRLRQVLMNLLGNAIKFTDNGSVTLKVERKDDLCITFSVIDTGVGIDNDAQNFIFSPFSQAGPGSTQKYGGTGLGLAISKDIIEKMDGELEVKSEQGKGTTFFFTIPIVIR